MTLPKRGEVWLVDLGLAAKIRPALAKLVRRLGVLTPAQLLAVEHTLCSWLGLPRPG